nr:PP2C family protein-serine/threonine phosphatase [Lysinibacillus timonensis]
MQLNRELFHDIKSIDFQRKSLEREINLAKNIQSTLLNADKPTLEHDELSGISIPARLIGGDYFDFYPLSNGKMRIIIGDVMGKGIPAAMLMILTRGAFRAAAGSTKGPGDTLKAMNNAIFKDLRTLHSFVTVFCADWDSDAGTFTYACAGHSLPEIIKRNQNKVRVPSVKGIMLGGLPNQIYQEKTISLSEGDLVFMYTDGIIEAVNKSGDMFKVDRLSVLLKSVVSKNVKEIEKSVIETVNQYTEGLPQKDDITMVMLKIGKRGQ